MPPIPQMTVSQNGIRSRLPGAKNFPSSPMITPPMIVHRIRPISAPSSPQPEVPGSAESPTHVHDGASEVDAGRFGTPPAWRSAAEPDRPGRAGDDLEVGDGLPGPYPPPAAGVGQAEAAVLAGQGLGQGGLDLLGGVGGVHDQLAG